MNTETDKWVGYFPIPNNRNVERILDHSHIKSRKISDSVSSKLKIILDLIGEKYLHQARLTAGYKEYSLIEWRDSKILHFVLQSNFENDSIEFKFYKCIEKGNFIKMYEFVTIIPDDIVGMDSWINKIKEELVKIYK